jgi:hypothetical protein
MMDACLITSSRCVAASLHSRSDSTYNLRSEPSRLPPSSASDADAEPSPLSSFAFSCCAAGASVHALAGVGSLARVDLRGSPSAPFDDVRV